MEVKSTTRFGLHRCVRFFAYANKENILLERMKSGGQIGFMRSSETG